MHSSRDTGRRHFIRIGITALAASTPSAKLLAQAANLSDSLPSGAALLDPAHAGATVPTDFIGLSYETSQLAEPAYFSQDNRGLVSSFTALSSSGVLRIGGNTSDFCWFRASAKTPAPARPENANDKGIGELAPNLSVQPRIQSAFFSFPPGTDEVHNEQL